MVYMYIYDSRVMFVICFVYVVKRLEHLIKMNNYYPDCQCVLFCFEAILN